MRRTQTLTNDYDNIKEVGAISVPNDAPHAMNAVVACATASTAKSTVVQSAQFT
jgi:hypothetical protein